MGLGRNGNLGRSVGNVRGGGFRRYPDPSYPLTMIPPSFRDLSLKSIVPAPPPQHRLRRSLSVHQGR